MSAYLRERIGCKVHKVSLHSGMTCPNRDGTVGVGGCAYCANESFSREALKGERPIREQMAEGIERLRARAGATKFIAYFQSFSNTYAPVERLRRLYDEAVEFQDVVGLSIGTRPDCVPEDVLDLVEGYAGRVEAWMEYGLQTRHDATLRRINRGHDFAAFADAVERTRRRGIKVCAHVILGLPGESRADMMATADALAALDVEGVKLHHLHIVRGTPMAEAYEAGEVEVLSAEAYVPLACDFLERLPSRVVVQRLMGETTRSDMLVAPVWPRSKSEVLRMIENEFRRRGTWQGARR